VTVGSERLQQRGTVCIEPLQVGLCPLSNSHLNCQHG
jgi:hypothetical protein